MTSPAPALSFRCNICGTDCSFPLSELGRETPSCSTCNSTPRVRAIVDILARNLFGQSIPLPSFPANKNVRGLGLTDSENYAVGLAQKFNYQNTYLHQEPQFDITASLEADQMGAFDFIISSEIFEHVRPPVERAFENSFQLLKPGGLFILTVPYGRQAHTLEHFPDLDEFTIAEVRGNHVLTNRTRDGVLQQFHQLTFHGGPGSTLEMRVFSECDLAQHMTKAGFADVTFHHESCLPYGIMWRETWSRPISARRPKSASS